MVKPSLIALAKTAITSKILKHDKDYFSNIIVNALEISKEPVIKTIKGGSFTDSSIFNGIVFEKCFTYAGYEQQPKKILNPKILLTNVELEWKSERENAEMRISNVEEYQKIVNAEWQIIKDKLDNIIKSGANVILSSSAIGDYATQYFARFDIFCAGRVHQSDINSILKSCNGTLVTNLNENLLEENQLIKIECFEEKQIGNKKYNFLEMKNASTIILRGPGDEILSEMERSVNDAKMIVKKNMGKKVKLVTGGGSTEIGLSISLRNFGYSDGTNKMFVYFAISEAFEKYVSTLANNFGIDAQLAISNLKSVHEKGMIYHGLVKNEEMVCDMRSNGVYEPLNLKRNILMTAFNAAKTILMIDSTILITKKK